MIRRNFISMLLLTSLPLGDELKIRFEQIKKAVVVPEKSWSKIAIAGIMKFESYYAEPYICEGGQWTIGYGSTSKRAKSFSYVSKAEAEKLLIEELNANRKIVEQNVDVPITEHQLWSLISFTFNTGEANLRKLINGPGRLNDHGHDDVPKYMKRYVYAGGKKLRGLEKRREWEVKVWKGTLDEA